MGKLSSIKDIPLLGSILFSVYMKLQQKHKESEHKRIVKEMIFPQGKKIIYLDIPIHSNLGDLAQYVCIKRWINENYPDYKCIEIDGLLLSDLKCGIIDKLKDNLLETDIIIFQSGYCTQDLGGYHDLIHRLIVEAFPNNAIIMFPQTVYFQNAKNGERTARVYENHNKIFFMARDFMSAEIAKKLFNRLEIRTYCCSAN